MDAPMKISIKHRLYFAFLAATGLVVISMFLITKFSFQRSLLRYVNTVEQERLLRLESLLIKGYEKHGNWNFLTSNRRLWKHLLISSRHEPAFSHLCLEERDRRPPSASGFPPPPEGLPGAPSPMHQTFEWRVSLLDSEKDKKHEEKEVMVPEKAELVSPFEEMERWFGDFFNRPFFSPMWMPRFNLPRMQQVTPSLDIYEEEDAVVVKAELPGIGKEDVEVDISDDLLTISGEKKAEEKLERKDYHRIERSYGSFSRSVRLPGEVLSDQAKASFKDGVLEVRIPKTEAAKQKRRKIEIE